VNTPTGPRDPTRRTRSGLAADDTQPVRAARAGGPRPWLFLALAAGAAAFVLLAAAGSGYGAGLSASEATLSGQNVFAVEEQFNLGVEDLLAGRYDLATQRF